MERTELLSVTIENDTNLKEKAILADCKLREFAVEYNISSTILNQLCDLFRSIFNDSEIVNELYNLRYSADRSIPTEVNIKDPLEYLEYSNAHTGANGAENNQEFSLVEDDDDDEKPLRYLLENDNLKHFFENNIPNSLLNGCNNPNDNSLYNNSDSDDHEDKNFLMSAESLIFPQGSFTCELCGRAYFTEVGLQAHFIIHAPKEKISAKKFPSTKRDRNKKVKSENDKIKLEQLEDQQLTEIKPKETVKTKRLYPCQVCGKQMISASKLRYHMVMHTGEKDYLCTICPKAYSTIYALKHHIRAHTGERPYKCKFCSDRFLRPTTLKSHMRRHTGERPYGCDICGKRFIQHSSMATHIKLNHMAKTIPCSYCDKKYARQTDLNTHLLSHSGERPYACQLCPSRFIRQSNLNKHMNQHHNGKDSKSKKAAYNAFGDLSFNKISTSLEENNEKL